MILLRRLLAAGCFDPPFLFTMMLLVAALAYSPLVHASSAIICFPPFVLLPFSPLDPKTARRVLNINVGIMGHVDSGKTSLAKVLSR
jgi:hypothetical protein